jgi:hypothetical protein
MPLIRFQLRTIMVAVAAVAVLMVVLGASSAVFYLFVAISSVVHLSLCVLVLSLALLGPIALFAVCDWLIRMGWRRFPRGQSLIPETGAGPKRGAQESVG